MKLQFSVAHIVKMKDRFQGNENKKIKNINKSKHLKNKNEIKLFYIHTKKNDLKKKLFNLFMKNKTKINHWLTSIQHIVLKISLYF